MARAELDRAVRIGFERTLEQDAALGIRQLVDMACKALSSAVNDPYTAVQAVDHLSVIFCALAIRPLGDWVITDPGGATIVVPGRRFGDYLATMCGLIRRYGSAEPTLSVALLRLLGSCAAVLPSDPARWSALAEQADLILADAARAIGQPADLTAVTAAHAALHDTVRGHLQAPGGPRWHPPGPPGMRRADLLEPASTQHRHGNVESPSAATRRRSHSRTVPSRNGPCGKVLRAAEKRRPSRSLPGDGSQTSPIFATLGSHRE